MKIRYNALSGIILTLFITQSALAEDATLSCPDKPNCVSSAASDEHYIAPLKATDIPTTEVRAKLEKILQNWSDIEIISSNSTTINAVSTSKWMGFKDDFVLVINPDGTIDVRSSSRTGYYDFGVNRDRVEQLRAELSQ